jgi:glycosyltransferase involved in cell wall biosynthesis
VDLYYLLDISPISAQATLLDIRNYKSKSGIYRSESFKELDLFYNYLPKEKTFIINRKTNKPAVSNIKLQFELVKFFHEISPDLIHFNTEFNHHYLLTLLKTKYPFVCTIHDPILHSDENIFKETLKRTIFFKFIKNFIILNEYQKERFIKQYRLQKKNVFISSLSIYEYLNESSHFQINAIAKNTKMNILFFGRVNKYKGINYLLDAFRILVKKYPECNLVIAGKGNINLRIDLSEKVTFINRFIPNDELCRLIVESQFVVCPYTDATQSGVIMTAFAFAKPVIATNVGGLNEFVEDGTTGLLIEPRDANILEKAIEKMVSNPELIINMRKKIQDKYIDGDHSWGKIAKLTIDIYNKLL